MRYEIEFDKEDVITNGELTVLLNTINIIKGKYCCMIVKGL